jgi:hypothetical protein
MTGKPAENVNLDVCVGLSREDSTVVLELGVNAVALNYSLSLKIFFLRFDLRCMI